MPSQTSPFGPVGPPNTTTPRGAWNAFGRESYVGSAALNGTPISETDPPLRNYARRDARGEPAFWGPSLRNRPNPYKYECSHGDCVHPNQCAEKWRLVCIELDAAKRKQGEEEKTACGTKKIPQRVQDGKA
jgi:hypothetical protein